MRSYSEGMTGPLRSLWDAPAARPAPPERVWRDWALVGILLPLILVEAVLRPELPGVWLWAVATALPVPVLLVRRTKPLVAFAVASGIMAIATVIAGNPGQLYTSAWVAVLLYAAVRWGSGRAVIVVAGIVILSIALDAWPGRAPIADLIGAVTVTVAIVALAAAFRARATSRLRERDRLVLLERERLARELHDTVAHHVSAIAISAQAGLATADTDPDAATRALGIIEAEASRTLVEMRTIVRALRGSEAADLAPSPTIADLADLTGPAGARPAVELSIRGEADRLDPSIASAVHRIAREAVTNARRHAPGASLVTIDVEVAADRVRLTVQDDGVASPPSEPGFGIRGMIERAALLGGNATAGPRAGGGWVVTAELPVAAARTGGGAP